MTKIAKQPPLNELPFSLALLACCREPQGLDALVTFFDASGVVFDEETIAERLTALAVSGDVTACGAGWQAVAQAGRQGELEFGG